MVVYWRKGCRSASGSSWRWQAGWRTSRGSTCGRPPTRRRTSRSVKTATRSYPPWSSAACRTPTRPPREGAWPRSDHPDARRRSGLIAPVRLLLNLVWLVLGGFWLFLGYVLAGVLLCIPIITIPWAIAGLRIAGFAPLAVRPDHRRQPRRRASGRYRQRVWFVPGRLVAGHRTRRVRPLALAVTIIGIPLALADLKLIPVLWRRSARTSSPPAAASSTATASRPREVLAAPGRPRTCGGSGPRMIRTKATTAARAALRSPRRSRPCR